MEDAVHDWSAAYEEWCLKQVGESKVFTHSVLKVSLLNGLFSFFHMKFLTLQGYLYRGTVPQKRCRCSHS